MQSSEQHHAWRAIVFEYNKEYMKRIERLYKSSCHNINIHFLLNKTFNL